MELDLQILYSFFQLLGHIDPRISNLNNRLILGFFFRMWLITESQNSFNLVLAQNSLKIAYEAPQGIRNNLLRTYATWGPDYFASLKPTAARIFFILACVNALLQERRNYIPQGWSKWYDFSDVDLIAAVKLTTPALAATNAQVPWKLLKGLCADAVYGGRIENIQDFSILESYLNQFFLDDVLSHRWKPFTLNNSIPLSTKYDVIYSSTYLWIYL